MNQLNGFCRTIAYAKAATDAPVLNDTIGVSGFFDGLYLTALIGTDPATDT
jgi:hypothetical protein